MAKVDETTVEKKFEEKSSNFSLPKRKVKVVPVIKPTWVAKGHEAEFLFGESSSYGFVPKRDTNGTFVNPLTSEEADFLEKHPGLSLKVGDLSVHKKENNYWSQMKSIRLRKNDETLDLSDPVDYIKYKILLTYTDRIAPDQQSIRNKATYKYAIVDLDYEDSKKSVLADLSADAYVEYSKIRNDRGALADICFLLTNKRVSSSTTVEWLKGEVGTYVNKNPKRFLEVVRDEDLQLKVLLEKAVTYNSVAKDGTAYRTQGGDLMGVDKTAAILFLKNPSNSDHRIIIEEQVRRAEG